MEYQIIMKKKNTLNFKTPNTVKISLSNKRNFPQKINISLISWKMALEEEYVFFFSWRTEYKNELKI
jgi:hypothetical protein